MRSPNWMNYENVVMFVNSGMDLTWRDPVKNGTILHYWTGTPFNHHNSNQEDSLAVVKLLIENGVDLLAVNSLGYTPLLEAATGRDGEFPNLMVLDFLLERDEYSRLEKIEAMELAGALILGHVYNGLNHLFYKAFDYWRKALQLRQMDVEGSDHIQKTPLNLKTVCTSEWTTSEELEDVIGHPETYMIQSFLVRLRSFSFRSWEAVESLFCFCTKHFGLLRLRMETRSVEIFDIIWAMLETLCQCDPFREHGALESLTKLLVGKVIRLFSGSRMSNPNYLTEKIVKTSIELVLNVIRLPHIKKSQLIPLVDIFFRLPQSLNFGALKTLILVL